MTILHVYIVCSVRIILQFVVIGAASYFDYPVVPIERATVKFIIVKIRC